MFAQIQLQINVYQAKIGAYVRENILPTPFSTYHFVWVVFRLKQAERRYLIHLWARAAWTRPARRRQGRNQGRPSVPAVPPSAASLSCPRRLLSPDCFPPAIPFRRPAFRPPLPLGALPCQHPPHGGTARWPARFHLPPVMNIPFSSLRGLAVALPLALCSAACEQHPPAAPDTASRAGEAVEAQFTDPPDPAPAPEGAAADRS